MATLEEELIAKVAEVRKSRNKAEGIRQDGIRQARTFINHAATEGLRRASVAFVAASNVPSYPNGGNYAESVGVSPVSNTDDGASVSITVKAKPYPDFTYTIEASASAGPEASAFAKVPKLQDGRPTNETTMRPLGKLKRSESTDFNVTDDDVLRDFTAAYAEYLETIQSQPDQSEYWATIGRAFNS